MFREAARFRGRTLSARGGMPDNLEEMGFMKHIRGITSGKMAKADALADLYNALWQTWLDYVYTKKNAIVTPTS